MRAFRISDHSHAPAFSWIERQNPGPGQVRVRIAACGINFADLLIANGTYQDMPPLPATLGMEVAGRIDAVGSGVAHLVPGDRVAVFSGHGGLAEYGVFDARRIRTIPDNMPFVDAAGFMVAYGTSHLALAHRAALSPGEKLVVLGASGGVGLTAVEIGKVMGAEVIAVARGPEKLEIARLAGADHLIDSDDGHVREAIREHGGGDVIYDPVGGALGEAAMRATRPEARVILIGFASGHVTRLAANHLMVKNVSVLGFYWGGYAAFAPGRLDRSLDTLFDWYGTDRIRPHVSHEIPFDRAEEALELLQSRRSTGKVVVTIP